MRMRLIVMPALALAAGIYFWQTATPAPLIPACTWRSGSGTEFRQGQNYDDLLPESPIRLSVTCYEPRHFYVFSFSAEDGTVLLFPSPAIRSDLANPLGTGQSVLPGQLVADEKSTEIAWTSRAGIQSVTTFLALASSEKIDELEQLLPKLRMWTNTVFPDHSMAVTKAGANEAGGPVELVGKPREPLPTALLRAAADIGNPEPNPNGPMRPVPGRPGIFMASWKVRERAAPPKPADGTPAEATGDPKSPIPAGLPGTSGKKD